MGGAAHETATRTAIATGPRTLSMPSPARRQRMIARKFECLLRSRIITGFFAFGLACTTATKQISTWLPSCTGTSTSTSTNTTGIQSIICIFPGRRNPSNRSLVAEMQRRAFANCQTVLRFVVRCSLLQSSQGNACPQHQPHVPSLLSGRFTRENQHMLCSNVTVAYHDFN